MRDRDSDTSLTLLEQLGDQSDEASWSRLHELYAPLLRTWLVRYDIQAADADDLIQEVLVVVFRELPSFQHSRQVGSFRSWLRNILVNRLRNFWRQRGRDVISGDSELARRLNEFEDPHSQLSQIWDRQHDQHLLRRLLEMIEPRFTETTIRAFRRMALDGAKGDEVAAELNLSLSAVFNAKSRVTRELRRLGKGMLS